MQQPSFWFILLSEIVIAGIAMYGFYRIFVKPNLKKEEDQPSHKSSAGKEHSSHNGSGGNIIPSKTTTDTSVKKDRPL